MARSSGRVTILGHSLAITGGALAVISLFLPWLLITTTRLRCGASLHSCVQVGPTVVTQSGWQIIFQGEGQSIGSQLLPYPFFALLPLTLAVVLLGMTLYAVIEAPSRIYSTLYLALTLIGVCVLIFNNIVVFANAAAYDVTMLTVGIAVAVMGIAYLIMLLGGILMFRTSRPIQRRRTAVSPA